MKKAYDQGTLMMLGEVVARIGCAAAMPNDHKNEWMQNRFSLKPAGRIQIPGRKGTHLVWRAADVEKARKLWDDAHPKVETKPGAKRKPIQIGFGGPCELVFAEELKAMDAETPGWKKTPSAAPELARSMIDLAGQLLKQATVLLGVPA